MGQRDDPVEVVSGTTSRIDEAAGLCLIEDAARSTVLHVASRVNLEVPSFPIEVDAGGPPQGSPQTSTVVLGADVLRDCPEFVTIAPAG